MIAIAAAVVAGAVAFTRRRGRAGRAQVRRDIDRLRGWSGQDRSAKDEPPAE